MKLSTQRVRLPSDASSAGASVPALSDLNRERLIEIYQEAMLLEDNEIRQRLAAESMRYHVSNRSPAQIVLMEQFKGLTHR